MTHTFTVFYAQAQHRPKLVFSISPKDTLTFRLQQLGNRTTNPSNGSLLTLRHSHSTSVGNICSASRC